MMRMRFGIDGKKNGTMSGTRLGKLAVTAILLTSFTILMPLSAYAERDEESSWWQRMRAKRESSSSSLPSTTTSNVAGNKSGKAVTKTEVFADRSVTPMVSVNSVSALTNAISRYEDIAAKGGWGVVPYKNLGKGDDGDAVVALKRRLIAENYLSAEALTGDTGVWFTASVEKAVGQYQANNGLAVTGKLDKATVAALNVPVSKRLATMRVNLPRIAEYSKDLADRYITVNVPALQLEAVNHGAVFSRHNVIAGSPQRPTPVTMSQVTDINFNPYWNVPVSIVERDLLPRIRRSGVSVFREMRMRIFDRWNGPEVDPRTVDWDHVAADRYFFREDPGQSNSMASVKINFLSPFGIYLHDTPTKALFAAGARYLSSGCVRVEQVSTLVNWILNGQDGWSPARIEQIKQSEERLDVKVQNAPQVRTVYLTAWVNGAGQVNFRPDIYDLDSTGFVVGQPLAPGELSDDGQRYVLKAQVYKVEEVPEGFSIFGSRRRTASTGNDEPFSFFRPRSRDDGRTFFFGSTDTKAKKSLADVDDGDGVVNNFNRSSSGNVKKKVFFDFKKKKWLGGDKTDATATGKKKPAKTANAKKKKIDQTAANQKKPQATATTQPVKKKKKLEEASATSAPAATSTPAAKPAPAGPVFGGAQ
jgi:murein L,D-transpeptidase YcbB/YkuD